MQFTVMVSCGKKRQYNRNGGKKENHEDEHKNPGTAVLNGRNENHWRWAGKDKDKETYFFFKSKWCIKIFNQTKPV